MEHVDAAGLLTDEPPAPRSRRRAWPWLVAAAVLAVVALVIVADRRSTGSNSTSAAEIDSKVKAAVDKSVEEARDAPPDSAQVYQAILPSLVLIQAERDGKADQSGLGTGVIVNAEGAIVTARHVIAGARGIGITFADGTKAK